MLLKKKLNIADYLSIYRIIAMPMVVFAVADGHRILTGILLAISFFTDGIDGFIARKKHIASSRGAKLDSIGDLITLMLGLAAFVVFETEYFMSHLSLIIISASLFFFQIALALIRFKRISSYHTYLAKATAILIGAFFILTPLTGPIDTLFYVAFYVGILEAIEEIIITFILSKPEENVKGLYWILKRSDEI